MPTRTPPVPEFQRADWIADASCRYKSPAMLAFVDKYRGGRMPTHAEWVNEFFGGRGGRPRRGTNHSSDYADIRTLCAACPTRDTCADAAIRVEPRFGLFGGLVERERREARKASGIGRPPSLHVHGTASGYKRHLKEGTAVCWQCHDAISRQSEYGRVAS